MYRVTNQADSRPIVRERHIYRVVIDIKDVDKGWDEYWKPNQGTADMNGGVHGWALRRTCARFIRIVRAATRSGGAPIPAHLDFKPTDGVDFLLRAPAQEELRQQVAAVLARPAGHALTPSTDLNPQTQA